MLGRVGGRKTWQNSQLPNQNSNPGPSVYKERVLMNIPRHLVFDVVLCYAEQVVLMAGLQWSGGECARTHARTHRARERGLRNIESRFTKHFADRI